MAFFPSFVCLFFPKWMNWKSVLSGAASYANLYLQMSAPLFSSRKVIFTYIAQGNRFQRMAINNGFKSVLCAIKNHVFLTKICFSLRLGLHKGEKLLYVLTFKH